ncbi:hypothetical protein PPYR_07167 [Photinus pyralis]|uniref:acid phosphatase n=2 Tax=Photinus pyralis TaxID=7054 RepID=A0A5N4APN4_PHOPY|nr:lysosomal acid phosphatase-like [Photinus pyralis]KAB0799287.1 hypothetical protein PPYR_07167 [Photinus pyralis]
MFVVPRSVILLLLVSEGLINHSSCEVEDTLLSVIVIYRHGDRAPIRPYQTDPYKDPSNWPMGWGQLTKIGKRQQYDLGRWLRERYKNFLPEEFSPRDIYVRSTDVDRTLMSAQCNLAGLFPPDANQTWNSNLAWQPVPVHTVPEQLDPVLSMKKPCERYRQLYQALFTTREFVDIQRENRELYEYLTQNTGNEIYNLETLEQLYNTLFIEELHNHTLPEWTKSVYPHKMARWADMSFALYTYNPKLALLRTGPLMDVIYKAFDNASLPKMHMFSAHDTTIADILNTLGIFDRHSPPYASTILFELRARGVNRLVNILYKNSTTPQRMILKDCQFDCPLDTFNEILDRIRLSDGEWESACEARFLGMVQFGTLQTGVFLGCMGLLFVLLCSFIISIVWSRRRRETVNYLRIPNQEE